MNRKILSKVYILTLIIMAFTGFGQLPIFKRYYVSDIPGMAWSAEFYLTHRIHYLGAILLLGLFAYLIMDFALSGRKTLRLTSASYVRMIFLGGLVITGILRALKNLPDVTFSPNFTLFIDVAHLVFTMLFFLTALLFLILKRGWVVSR